jgi:hypothetical protein
MRPLLTNGMFCLALGFSLLTEMSFALAQTPSPTLIAEAPTFAAPASGALSTAPPAPVPVPPSGVLLTPPTAERHAVTTVPIKAAQTVKIAKSAKPVAMHRHVVHRPSTARLETPPRTMTADQSVVGVEPTPKTAQGRSWVGFFKSPCLFSASNRPRPAATPHRRHESPRSRRCAQNT